MNDLHRCCWRSCADFFILVKTCLSDQESQDSFHVLNFNESCNKLQDLWHSNSIDSIICDQTHLHFLVAVVIVVSCLKTELLNNLPLIVVEFDQVKGGRRGVHELEKLDSTGCSIDSEFKNAKVGTAKVVEHIFVFFFSSKAHSFWGKVKPELVPDFAGKGA